MGALAGTGARRTVPTRTTSVQDAGTGARNGCVQRTLQRTLQRTVPTSVMSVPDVGTGAR